MDVLYFYIYDLNIPIPKKYTNIFHFDIAHHIGHIYNERLIEKRSFEYVFLLLAF